jgi:pimeloyl-ACP methyl ester carboxylesterase
VPESGDLSINGIRIRYYDWGGSGDPIVVLHATGFHGRVYRPIVEALTKIGHVWSYDQRGHGDSDTPDELENYNWALTMEDLGGFITAKGWNGVRAFGHSAGATAIGSLAYERPELISRAVLAEPVIFESPDAPELGWRNPFVERTLRRRPTFDSVDAMFANFSGKPPYHTWDRAMLRDYCEFGTREIGDGKRELKCPPKVEARLYETARDFDGLGRILAAKSPLLIMFGTRSDSLGTTLSPRVARERKAGRVIDVPDSGHFLPMEKPALVSQLAVDFLK